VVVRPRGRPYAEKLHSYSASFAGQGLIVAVDEVVLNIYALLYLGQSRLSADGQRDVLSKIGSFNVSFVVWPRLQITSKPLSRPPDIPRPPRTNGDLEMFYRLWVIVTRQQQPHPVNRA
jgi:hypothetical protein